MPALPLPLRLIAPLVLVALTLAGCGSMTPPSAGSSSSSSADQRAALPAALVVERQWLQSWFQDTPVRVAQQGEAVTIDVPREFCFDPGRSQVKAPLGAVLDKVAESLRRLPLARLTLIAAPDDAGGTSPLAQQRAAQVHRQLRTRAAPAGQLGSPGVTPVAAVQLRLEASTP